MKFLLKLKSDQVEINTNVIKIRFSFRIKPDYTLNHLFLFFAGCSCQKILRKNNNFSLRAKYWDHVWESRKNNDYRCISANHILILPLREMTSRENDEKGRRFTFCIAGNVAVDASLLLTATSQTFALFKKNMHLMKLQKHQLYNSLFFLIPP